MPVKKKKDKTVERRKVVFEDEMVSLCVLVSVYPFCRVCGFALKFKREL